MFSYPFMRMLLSTFLSVFPTAFFRRAGLLISLAVLAVDASGADRRPRVEILGRYIAVDGACGWPQLTTLPNGEIAATFWPHPNHGFTEGAAECWISADQGLTWQRTSVPVPNAPGDARLNFAAGLAADNSYVVLMGGFPGKVPLADQRKFRVPDPLPPPLSAIPARSTDLGRTWQQFPALALHGKANDRNLVPYGRVAAVDAHTTGAMIYLDDVLFCVSPDNGATWTARGQVGKTGQYNETTWHRLANGDLYAVARTYDDAHLDGWRSKDQGATWTFEQALTLPAQHPADVITLRDGRLLLTYGVRNEGLRAIFVRIGDATATKWGAPICIVNLEDSTDLQVDEISRLYNPGRPSSDGGYPSTVETPDGVLVTAYYCKGIPAHRRYHVGVVRWQLASLK